MILFDLKCTNDHVYETWFRDGAAYDELKAAKKLVCPVCGSKKVEKALMAPRLSTGKGAEERPAPAPKGPGVPPEAAKTLDEMRRQVVANCDYVGPNFAEEARKIHYGEVDKRGIYGEASPDEAKSLTDEGIDFHSIPWPARGDA